MTTSGATSDNQPYNGWKRVVQGATMSDNEWQQVAISANFLFFWIKEEPTTTKHSKDNPSSDCHWTQTLEFLDIQETIEYGFNLKRVRDMARTYSQNPLNFEEDLEQRLLN